VGLNTSDNKNFASYVRWGTVGLGAVVAISSAVEEFFHYGDRWRHYRHTTESLKTQGWQFSQLSGLYSGYKSHQEAFSNFATQIEDILQRDVDVYVTEVVYKKEKQKEEGEQELMKGIIPQSPTDNKASEKNIS
jgi:protein subunit release factor A